MSLTSTRSIRETRILKVREATGTEADDVVAVEEPLAIRVAYDDANGARVETTLSITMRTPGDDRDLAVGFACTEGIVRSREDIVGVREESENVVTLDLRSGENVNRASLERHFVTSSSCGVCGKTSLDAIRIATTAALAAGPVVDPRVIHDLPAALRREQSLFERTGGIHAAGLFDAAGQVRGLREDVGRHNAVDKLVGMQLLGGALPLGAFILMVSGRASFELVQKARVAGIPILAAVGAPSSLAIDLAREEGMTVLGFVRDGRFNVYCGGERIAGSLRR